jgi:RNA polymerase sporulation-specific sigma factor
MDSGKSSGTERRILDFSFWEETNASGQLERAVSDSLTTQVLIQRIGHGDQTALDGLCRRYLSRVLVAVRLRLGANLRKKVESGDIVQEVMIDAIRNIKEFSFRTEGAFLKYLNRVVENRIRDEADRWAAQKRRPDREIPLDGARSDESALPLQIADSAPTPSKVVALTEDLSLLEAAIGRLPDEYQDLIIATKLEGRSYEEIAEDVDKTADAVRMQVSRAMIALNKVFRQMLEDRQRYEHGQLR